MTRLASMDKVVLLAMDTADHPLHLGVLQLYRPPQEARPDFGRQTFEALRACTDVSRTFAGHPVGTSKVWWTFDRHVEIDHHLHYHLLPATGGMRELFALVSDLHSRPLDPARPLWEAHLIDGLDDGRYAMYIKAHHALADGTTGARVIQGALSTDPEDTVVRGSWSPAPGQRDKAATSVARRTTPVAAVRAARRVLTVMKTSLRQRDLIPAFHAPTTVFNFTDGGDRRCAVESWPMSRVADVSTKAGVTANDVALAMCSGALRAYLIERDALPDMPLVAMVPVNLRDEHDADAGNIISGAVCNLATDLDDPADRLHAVHASMQHNVSMIRQLPRRVAVQLPGLINLPVSGTTGPRARIPPAFNLLISSMRGSDDPLYRNGARLESTYPLAPTLWRQGLNIGLFHGGDALDIGIVASVSAVPDPECLLGHLETSLSDMERSTDRHLPEKP